MANLLILGAGGHGRVVKEIAESLNKFDRIEFLDDQSDKAIGSFERCSDFTHVFEFAFPAIGNNELRIAWLNKLEQYGYSIPTLVHNSAYISQSAVIQKGCVVGPKAMVNTNVVIEAGCIIGMGSIIDHDTKIMPGCHIDVGAIVSSHQTISFMTKVVSGSIYSKTGPATP